MTHLSLAHWPVPSLTPNAKNTVVQSQHGQEIQYGGTNHYSHTLDNDFREAADVLRRLADRLPGLEYLDLTGCTDWLRALRWMGDGNDLSIDWGTQWVKLRTLNVYSGLRLSPESEYSEVIQYVMAYREALITEEMLRFWMRRSKGSGRTRTTNWIDVQKDDWEAYRDLWPAVEATTDQARKRIALMALDSNDFVGGNQWTRPLVLDPNAAQDESAVERMSVWDS